MEDDALINTIGEIGQFHWIIYFTTGATVILHAWQMMSSKFLTYKTPHYCKRPGNVFQGLGLSFRLYTCLTDIYKNISLEAWLDISAPFLTPGDLEDVELDRCRVFDIDFEKSPIWKRPNTAREIKGIDCLEFEYDESLFQVRFQRFCVTQSPQFYWLF